MDTKNRLMYVPVRVCPRGLLLGFIYKVDKSASYRFDLKGRIFKPLSHCYMSGIKLAIDVPSLFLHKTGQEYCEK